MLTTLFDTGKTHKTLVVKIMHMSIVRLDMMNYFTWKAHPLAHLREYELLPYIEHPIGEKDALIVQQDQLLLVWLFFAIVTKPTPTT